MQTAIITGATSGIGVSLIEACRKHGCKVIAVARRNSPNIQRLEQFQGLCIVEGGLAELRQFVLARCLAKDSVFYHLAWSDTDKVGRNDPQLQQKNIASTMDALRLAKELGCRQFVGAGSQAEYGVHIGPKTGPDSPACPNTAYGICKYAAGRLGAMLAEQLGIDFSWVRIFSVYGEYDLPGTLIQSTIAKLIQGEHCSFTEGTHLWDYLYSADAGKALYLIGEKVAGTHVYCLGSGQARLLREYICEMRDMIRPEAVLGLGEIPYSDQNRFDLCADIASLQKDTGWKPETDFQMGIRYILEKGRKPG